MDSWTLRARSRTDSREKMSPELNGLNSERFAFFTRAHAGHSLIYFIHMYMCVHMIHLREISGAQWPPCDDPKGRTLSRSLKCRYICRRRMSRHKISTRRRRRLALISLGRFTYLLRAHTHTHTRQTYNARRGLLHPIHNYHWRDEGSSNIFEKCNFVKISL